MGRSIVDRVLSPMNSRRPLRWASAHELLPDRFRPMLLRRLGFHVGENVGITSGLNIIGEGIVHIGAGVFINHDCIIESAGDVTLEENVVMGYRVTITTSAHDMTDPDHRGGPWVTAPVTIGKGAWLGASVIVMSGVTIGPGAVVGAGSIVTRDCEPHGLYLGSPARWVKDLSGADLAKPRLVTAAN
jgi:maltose O-acetyltransferase